MWTWITLIVLALAAPILVMRRIAKAERRALGKLMELRLEGLKFEIADWKGCEYDLVSYDSDRHPERHHYWRTITIQPNAATTWSINIDRQQRYRLSLVQKGQSETCYPKRYGWSTEAWLKKRVDLMLWQIGQLPPPRNIDEWLARSQAEHQAFMAESERLQQEHLRWLAERQTIGGGTYPSLDDPVDDMD